MEKVLFLYCRHWSDILLFLQAFLLSISYFCLDLTVYEFLRGSLKWLVLLFRKEDLDIKSCKLIYGHFSLVSSYQKDLKKFSFRENESNPTPFFSSSWFCNRVVRKLEIFAIQKCFFGYLNLKSFLVIRVISNCFKMIGEWIRNIAYST